MIGKQREWKRKRRKRDLDTFTDVVNVGFIKGEGTTKVDVLAFSGKLAFSKTGEAAASEDRDAFEETLTRREESGLPVVHKVLEVGEISDRGRSYIELDVELIDEDGVPVFNRLFSGAKDEVKVVEDEFSVRALERLTEMAHLLTQFPPEDVFEDTRDGFDEEDRADLEELTGLAGVPEEKANVAHGNTSGVEDL